MDFAKPDTDKLILMSEMSKDSIPDSSETNEKVISKLRSAGVLPETPLFLFLDQASSSETEKMIHFVNLSYIYISTKSVNNFMNLCERFKLNCNKDDDITTVLNFYESSLSKLGLPPKKRFEHHKIVLKLSINTEDNLESAINIIKKEATCPTEEPSLPTGTSKVTAKKTAKAEGKMEVEDSDDPNWESFGSCKKRTNTPPLEKIHNTRRRSTVSPTTHKSNSSCCKPTSSTSKKGPKLAKSLKAAKKTSAKTPACKNLEEAKPNKTCCKSKDQISQDENSDKENKATTKRGRQKKYKGYLKTDLDKAVLEIVLDDENPSKVGEKYGVPSRTIYDRLKKLKDNEGLGDCGVSPHVAEEYRRKKVKL